MYLARLLAFSLLVMHASVVSAQVVRFETSLGPFSIELFPDKAPLNVANFLNYVNSGRYDNTVINRAADDFVVQMGVFASPTSIPPDSFNDFIPIPTFAPVQGEPAQTTGLSNTRGSVGLALSGGAGGTNQNSGTSSFFVNWGDNSFLDPDFTVFGQVINMSTIDRILNAPKIDPGHPLYNPSNLAVSDIPLQENGELVFILSAEVVPEPSTVLICGLGLFFVPFHSRRLI